MKTIRLNIDRVLQGSFDLKPLNLLFVFQVNCPGCFIYGFPLVNQLYQQYKQFGLNVLGLSTAFEDFEYNNAANTVLLLTEMKLVGATRKALGDLYSQAIEFPIAIDQLTTGADLATPENIALLWEAIADSNNSSASENAVRQQISAYLHQHVKTSATFTLNRLPGTPTFLLVDQNLQLLDGWFGHKSEVEVIQRIETYLHLANSVAAESCR